MKTVQYLLITAALLGGLVNAHAAKHSEKALIERGQYIVTGLGLCADCHTPMSEKGEPNMSLWLMGSVLMFKPTIEMPWAPASPAIAGLPSMTKEQGVKFLMTGLRPDGSRPLPPMPSYRLNEADATAVVAYLKSLQPATAASGHN
jgi:mono/diheme cytochrome c family protein